jgi:RNA polymerase sigma factor (sigma-70 family)
MADPSDPELILLARQGDRAAFGRLMWRHQPMALRLARRVVGNYDLAQELVQEAMLQAYLSLEKLSDPASFKSWLYGIVLNVCRNDLRRRQVIYLSLETMLGNLTGEPLPIADNSPDPQLVAAQKELHTAILDAVDTLSPRVTP